MKERMKTVAKVFLAFAGFIVLMGIAGTADHVQEVISEMPDSVYVAIKATIGHDASDYEIVKEYEGHRYIYDTLYQEPLPHDY